VVVANARMAPPLGPNSISAPDLTGPTSLLNWPTAAGAGRKRRPVPFEHVRLEIDLRHEQLAPPRIPLLQQLEGLLRERAVVEQGDLMRLSAAALHALAARGFSRVDHWQVEPGGWLPLPEPTHATLAEPVGHLIRALESDAWRRVALAREFSVRLSGPTKFRADLVVRRVHRERGHSMTLELRGRIATRELEALVRALRGRLPVLRTRVEQYAYAGVGNPASARASR
jgi:hypothetical protein